ncbi:MAG TPA: rod shape-determining protein MreC [Abditibacteriaceae bacterium]|nr:rod shape-determining protein MreC [Abditibacteriaceae bacterium]
MPHRPPPLFILGFLVVICAVLVAWHNTARARGAISPPESVAFLALRPVQRVLVAVRDWCGDVGRTMIRRGGTIRENQLLKRQLANLEGQNRRLVHYQRENQELRALLEMPAPRGGKAVAAEVLALDATDYSRTIMLNVGSRQGVREKDVVYNAQGVVGQVIARDRFTCRVLLLIDSQARVGAMVSRTLAKGMVQGTGKNENDRACKMAYLDYGADVREGDLVVTSGESSLFPRGLVIGRVLKVEKDKTYSRMTADIEPAVAFDRLSAVYVRVRTGP